MLAQASGSRRLPAAMMKSFPAAMRKHGKWVQRLWRGRKGRALLRQWRGTEVRIRDFEGSGATTPAHLMSKTELSGWLHRIA